MNKGCDTAPTPRPLIAYPVAYRQTAITQESGQCRLEVNMNNSNSFNLNSKNSVRQQPQQQWQAHVPSTDEIKGKWKQQVGAAKIT